MTEKNLNQTKQLRKKRDPAYDDLPKKRSRLTGRIITFVLVLVLPAVLWGILSLAGLSEKLEFDTFENRNKHEIAEDVTLANLTAEAEAYYNDRVPFRAVLLNVDRGLNDLIEFPYKHMIEPVLLSLTGSSQSAQTSGFSAERNLILKVQGKLLSLTGDGVADENHEHVFRLAEHADPDYEHYGYDLYRCYCGEEKKEYIEKLIDDSYFPYVAAQVIEGRYGWLFYNEEIGDYVGNNIPDESELAQTASALQALQAAAQNRGKTFFTLALPNKSRIYSEYMPTLEKADPWRIKMFYDYMKNDSPAPFEYPYEELMAEKPMKVVYYDTDTHWNHNGAMVGLNKIREYAGLEKVDIESQPTESYPHAGDLTYMQGNPYNHVYDKVIYKPEVNVTSEYDNSDAGYGMFSMGAAEFYSDAEDERTVVMIGDSYMVALMEYLPKDFKHTVFINRGSLETILPNVIEEADIIIYEFVERNSPYMSGDLGSLSAILN